MALVYKNVLIMGDPMTKEGAAGGAVTPGHLVKENSSNAIVVHSTPGGSAVPLFAKENSDIGDGIDTAYASADRLLYYHCRPGDEVNAILSTSQTIVAGDFLESAGDGTLRKHTPDTVDTTASVTATIVDRAIVAVAREGKTTTSAVARIRVAVV